MTLLLSTALVLALCATHSTAEREAQKPEVIACEGKKMKDTCSVDGKDGWCVGNPKFTELWCMVKKGPGKPGGDDDGKGGKGGKGGSGEGPGKPGEGDKPEVIACEGKKMKDTCSVDGKDGWCIGKGILWCMVKKGPGKPGEGDDDGKDKPEVIACEGKKMKDTCSVDGKDGWCIGKGILWCMVKKGPGKGGKGGKGGPGKPGEGDDDGKDKPGVIACDGKEVEDKCSFEEDGVKKEGMCIGKDILWCMVQDEKPGEGGKGGKGGKGGGSGEAPGGGDGGKGGKGRGPPPEEKPEE